MARVRVKVKVKVEVIVSVRARTKVENAEDVCVKCEFKFGHVM